MPADFVLTLSCADRPGIVAAVTTELAALNANIAEINQFWDKRNRPRSSCASPSRRPMASAAMRWSAR